MRNIFKRSIDDNSNIPKKIPEISFNEHNSFLVEYYSRLTPDFEEMLDLQHARQMFQTYLRSFHLHKVFLCFLDLSDTKDCSEDCSFNDIADKERFVQLMIQIQKHFICHTDFKLLSDCLTNLECLLSDYCESGHKEDCIYMRLYHKYILESYYKSSEMGGADYIDERNCIPQIFIDTFIKSQSNRLPSIDFIKGALREYLKDGLYPQYLQSAFHQRYQLQLLNSGLNTLRLSDFIHSDPYLMLMIEFLDNHSLSHYLFFLMAIIKLSRFSSKCSFKEALHIYSEYLVMGSSNYIDVPSTVSNCVVNIICQNNSDSEHLIDVNASFSCAFKPVYLFIEQFWLPQFLISANYQKHLAYLTDAIDSFPVRSRNHSDAGHGPLSARPFDTLISQDDNSDISVDNASVQSEPTISFSEKTLDSHSSQSWWPPQKLYNRLTSLRSRPMTLGSFDDLGRYQSINSVKKRYNSCATNSSSSEILSTITELSSDIWTKVQFNGQNSSHNSTQYPDDVARQIIDDIHRMTLRNL